MTREKALAKATKIMPKTGPLPFALETQAQSLFVGWVRHFYAQDHELPYLFAEKAVFRVLREKPRPLLLTGIIDAEGDDFFLEAKTANPRGKATWRSEWLYSPQALTYGLITGGTKKFLVRKAFKSKVPEYDYEWFSFSPGDLDMWRRQVLDMAAEIDFYASRGDGPWPLNFKHGCFAYGPRYACPLWHDGCSKLNFDGPIPGSVPPEFFPEFEGQNRVLLQSVRDDIMKATEQIPLILTQSAIGDWMRCRELYRRTRYDGGSVAFPPSEASLLGARFHELLSAYNQSLIEKRSK